MLYPWALFIYYLSIARKNRVYRITTAIRGRDSVILMIENERYKISTSACRRRSGLSAYANTSESIPRQRGQRELESLFFFLHFLLFDVSTRIRDSQSNHGVAQHSRMRFARLGRTRLCLSLSLSSSSSFLSTFAAAFPPLTCVISQFADASGDANEHREEREGRDSRSYIIMYCRTRRGGGEGGRGRRRQSRTNAPDGALCAETFRFSNSPGTFTSSFPGTSGDVLVAVSRNVYALKHRPCMCARVFVCVCVSGEREASATRRARVEISAIN